MTAKRHARESSAQEVGHGQYSESDVITWAGAAIIMDIYTGWKEYKCHPFKCTGMVENTNIHKLIHTILSLNLIVFSEKGVSCSVLFTSYCLYTL